MSSRPGWTAQQDDSGCSQGWVGIGGAGGEGDDEKNIGRLLSIDLCISVTAEMERRRHVVNTLASELHYVGREKRKTVVRVTTEAPS